MDQKTKDARITEWSRLLCEAEASGMSNAKWCRKNGITEKRFYYWKRKIRQETSRTVPEKVMKIDADQKGPAFLELLPPAEAGKTESAGTEPCCTEENGQAVTLRVGDYLLSVSDPGAEQTLRMILKVLRDA